MKNSLTALLVASLMTVNFGVSAANSAQLQNASQAQGVAVGLIVKYKPGIAPVAANGEPTGENAAGSDLLLGQDLGLGFKSIDFVSDMLSSKAQAIADLIAQDPRVESASINGRFTLASVASSEPKLLPITPRSAPIRAASGPSSFKVKDVWSAANPHTTAVQLRWKAPSRLYGASISGYRIEYSTDGRHWLVYTSNTKSKSTEYSIKSRIQPGVKYWYSVMALTKIGSKIKTGSRSAKLPITATAAPNSPVIVGRATVSTQKTPLWATQNIVQRGGLNVTYTALASAPAKPTVSCQSVNASTCDLLGLEAGTDYQLTLTATNARASAPSLVQTTTSDSQFHAQWYLNSQYGIDADSAWPRGEGSSKVVVAVIDSGITTHPDLDASILRNSNGSYAGYDFVANADVSNDGDGRDADPRDPGDYVKNYYDINSPDYHNDVKYPNPSSSWHGTHVSGIIAGQHNSIGIAGIAPNTKILTVRALSSKGGVDSDLLAALNWSAGIRVADTPVNSNPAKVINMSIGTELPHPCEPSIKAAVQAVKAKGITMITAAGNSNMDALNSFPGNCFGTINIGATGFNGDRAFYSNYGLGVDLSAPGGDDTDLVGAPVDSAGQIVSTLNDGETTVGTASYAAMEGTSMAAPVVTGIVALLYAAKPTITPDQVWDVLRTTVRTFKPGGQCALNPTLCGAGIVNAGAAVAAALALPN